MNIRVGRLGKKLYVLENTPLEFREQAEALEAIGVDYVPVTSIDELLSRLESDDISEIGGFSLDLRIPAPPNLKIDENRRKWGGRWVCQEVLKPRDNRVILDAERAKALARKSVGFLTGYANDPRLRELLQEMSQQGHDIPVFAKDKASPEDYAQWAKSVIDRDYLFDEYFSSSLTACRLLETFGFCAREIIYALGGDDGSVAAKTNKSTKHDVWEILTKKYPPENCLCVADSVQRWNSIVAILARTFAVFDDNIEAARADLESGLDDFGGKSAREVIASGKISELAKLEDFLRKRWDR